MVVFDEVIKRGRRKKRVVVHLAMGQLTVSDSIQSKTWIFSNIMRHATECLIIAYALNLVNAYWHIESVSEIIVIFIVRCFHFRLRGVLFADCLMLDSIWLFGG
jgi:hypothetical protein